MSPFFILPVQEYVYVGQDETDRAAAGSPFTIPLNQGGGFLGGGSDDYSTYSNFVPFMPFPYIGKHEMECVGKAFSNDFDGSPISTASVSAPFTGDTQAGPAESVLALRTCHTPCRMTPCCSASY